MHIIHNYFYVNFMPNLNVHQKPTYAFKHQNNSGNKELFPKFYGSKIKYDSR